MKKTSVIIKISRIINTLDDDVLKTSLQSVVQLIVCSCLSIIVCFFQPISTGLYRAMYMGEWGHTVDSYIFENLKLNK